MEAKRRIRNIGILAHVDAGKTTVTEHMLFLSGSIKSIGNVDKGTSQSDGLDIEKKRGISVRATTLSFPWKDVQINLIDTPGHVDFSAEVERSLRVLDGVVLVLSAVEGIQAQTESIWQALEALNLPVILFINKIDRIGANTDALFHSLQKEFSPDMIRLNRAENEGESHATITDLSEDQKNEGIERIAEKDDALLETYLNEESIAPETLQNVLTKCVQKRQLFPVLCGCAKNNIGIEILLDQIVASFPDASTASDQPVSGVVFRLDHDPKLGRIAGVRLYTGQVQNRDTVLNTTANREEKITQIKKVGLNKYEDTGILQAGDIGFLCGMPEAKIGDILGDPGPVPGNYTLSEPLLSVQVKPQDEADHTRLAEALQQLASEDPHLHFEWFNQERELHIKIMGAIQTEILTDILKNRFEIDAHLTDPTVIYKETPTSIDYGADRYTMPKPCWAVLKFRLEPGERGTGVSYHSEVRTNDVKQKYQSEVAKTIPEALEQGIKGWEVTDLKITFTEGGDHVLHSRPGNFRLATNIALMKGLTATDTTLLEPILAFRISAPEEFIGKVTSHIIEMRGSFEPAEITNGKFTLQGKFPLATSMDYTIRLSSLTGGKARFSAHLDCYEACPDHLGVIREYKGINPLDRSKYILKMRGAITTSATA
ncbi:MAG: TetM/TetW/TetO/TetS family tetracycline resistance ribosomal protection protein [bacterium]|nr:TetM/TetW/TetO/TetS family tetracycline resistance ribosomal protection protein [bacterium]